MTKEDSSMPFVVVISQNCIECPVSIVLIEIKAVNHFGMMKMGVKSLDETCMLVLRFCKWLKANQSGKVIFYDIL